MKTDNRYTITFEYTGKPRPVYVVRFCGDWVGLAPNIKAARRMRNEHAAKRQAELAA